MTEVSIAQAIERGLEHHRAGRLPQAESVYRQILQAAPGHPAALHLLGVIAYEAGRNDAALELIDGAIAVHPGHPGYHGHRGLVLHALGRVDEAIASYRKALELRPGFAGAHSNLGDALYASGKFAEALLSYARALELNDAPVLEAAFARCLRGAVFDGVDAGFGSLQDIRRFAIRALSEPWARPTDLARACIRLIVHEPLVGECVARASVAWPERLPGPELFGPAGFAAVIGDALLRTLLESAQVCDLAMEQFLTTARLAMLDVAEKWRGDEPKGDELAFWGALARQCSINDYVYACVDGEAGRAGVLRAKLVAAMQSGASVPAQWIVAIGCYFPLVSLPGAETLLARACPEPLAALLVQQVAEPLAERELRARIPRLTSVDSETSRRVRQQYEEDPYPRWIRLAPPGGAQTINSHLRQLFPYSKFRPVDEDAGFDLLVAGCGTGQESIETAQQFPGAQVLAIDLSLASLGYATRKAGETGASNLEHAQADITCLASIGRNFDVISSVGVLHHLADPMAGWRQLSSLLRPGGFMRLGLYSELGRRDVVAARTFIAQRGYLPNAADIRRCRQDLMGAGNAAFVQLALRSDFYGTGECRDLLFHAQEHRFSLPRIAEMLDSLALRFVGFLLAPHVADLYAARFPDDRSMTDLNRWNDLEAEFPDAFAGMYLFWVQKRD